MVDKQTDEPTFRSRIIAEVFRIVATTPGSVTAFVVQRRCEAALNAKEEECAAQGEILNR